MKTSAQFTVAVHTLALLALETRPLSSTFIAGSVNTNPVVIRRLLGPLQAAGLVQTHLGTDGGTELVQAAADITLLDVFQAVEGGTVFALHNNTPNPQCICGRHIQPVLQNVYADLESAMESVLRATTIADIAADIAARQEAVAAAASH